jgi:anti-sigma regulatory factor (Ser/Thr protein kinase)
MDRLIQALHQPDRFAPDDAILVASELVTNAVVHSGATPADMIGVRVVSLEGVC